MSFKGVAIAWQFPGSTTHPRRGGSFRRVAQESKQGTGTQRCAMANCFWRMCAGHCDRLCR
ncbi:protein of unknown function [Azospirillum baldaniorum]|uniref:Uncharacterized protein n=1 Tax=Azospirillum baldaniorum TaxID=1064539 RepID=A0A9P1JSE7_9PROT|nr:protein of unknown function [Azospirillum baldaniorum]